jgi:hypothetical protein
MAHATVAQLLREYLVALTEDAFARYPLADDVVFRGPRLGPIIGAEPVRKVLSDVASAFSRLRVEQSGQLIDGDSAVLFLEVELPDGRGFAIADHLRFRDDQLVLLRPFFDAGLLESIGMAPSIAQLGPQAHL